MQPGYKKTFTCFDTHLIEVAPENIEYEYSKVSNLYQEMYEMRYVEEIISTMFQQGLIQGFCHLDIGQEAVYVAAKHAGKSGDKYIGSYRCHALALATGSTIQEVVGEVLGLRNGCAKGKGGSMHMYNNQMYGGHGIVGAQVSLGCGIAYALKYNFTGWEDSGFISDSVAFCFYGDGASNQGQVYESFSLANMLKLPIIFVVVNNRYAMWTPTEAVSPNDNFHRRSQYTPGIRVDGKDVCDIIKAMEIARGYAIKLGPIILQIDTYRLCGHSMTDSYKYREDAEVADFEMQDSIKRLREFLAHSSGKTFVEEMEENVRIKVDKEVLAAQKSSSLPISKLFDDVLLEK